MRSGGDSEVGSGKRFLGVVTGGVGGSVGGTDAGRWGHPGKAGAPSGTRVDGGAVPFMATSRDLFRYAVDLRAWVHIADRAVAAAGVVDLSRTGAGLWLTRSGRPGEADFSSSPDLEVGQEVRLAVADLVGGRPMVLQWPGRVAHARSCGLDDAVRVGLALDDLVLGPGAVAGAAELPWLLSDRLADVVRAPSVGVGLPRLDLLATSVALLGLAADQASKGWAWSEPAGLAAGGVLDLVPGLLAMAPAANAGTVASLADGLPWTARLCGLGALALAALAPVWAAGLPATRRLPARASALGAGLVTGGLVGNAADRLALGYVRDFLVSGLWPEWAFNLADVFLLLGAMTLLYTWLTGYRYPGRRETMANDG
jgi:signal peptidase II